MYLFIENWKRYMLTDVRLIYPEFAHTAMTAEKCIALNRKLWYRKYIY